MTIRDMLVTKLWRGVDPFSNFPEDLSSVDHQGWHTSQHHFFRDAISRLRPALIIEIGVWKGASTIHMANLLRELNIDGTVLAIDTWLGSSEHWISDQWFPSLRAHNGYPHIYDTFVNNVIDSQVRDQVLPLPLDSINASSVLNSLKLKSDLVHIDAGHDEISVSRDLDAWWPLLREGGALIGDDYYEDGEWPGVKRAFDAFCKARNLTLTTSNGKCIVFKPNAVTGYGPTIEHVKSLMLTPTQTIEYVGEFGAELILFLPYLHWLSTAGFLKECTIVTYSGMTFFYDNLDCRSVIEKIGVSREYVSAKERPSYLPIKDEWSFDGNWSSPFLHYPDFRRRLRDQAIALLDQEFLAKPLIVIHNKHTREFGFTEPQNFISLTDLDIIFKMLSDRFKIIYIRHGSGSFHNNGYADDHNVTEPFEDNAIICSYPDVTSFDDLLTRYERRFTLNRLKNLIYAACYNFITVQGGGAHHIACFSGSLMSILHRVGPEINSAYSYGFYNFASNPCPIRLICTDSTELQQSLRVHLDSNVVDQRAVPSTGTLPIVAALSPWAQAEVHRQQTCPLLSNSKGA